MIFKFPKKKVVLDCFTYDELILQSAPVTMAIKHIPDWWKRLSPSYMRESDFVPIGTMKNCIGMLDYYKRSVAIPLWSDLCINVVDEQYRWQFADNRTQALVHPIDKEAKGLLPNHGHMKIITPWVFKTNQEVNWVWSQPTYSFEEDVADVKVLPAVVNYYNQTTTSINMMVPLSKDKNYMLHHGQVLVHLTPMFDNKVDVVRHLVSQQKYERMKADQHTPTFLKKYMQINVAKKKFLDCPYHKEQ